MTNRIIRSEAKYPIVDAGLFALTSNEGKYLACLSERDIFIIRKHLWPYVTWRTRFARPLKDGSYELSTIEEYLVYVEHCHELDYKLTGGDFMTCLEDGLQAVALAIRELAASQCCEGGGIGSSGGIVSSWMDGEGVSRPIYGSGPPAVDDGETPPPGFDTYEDFLLNKCQVSNLVFDGWLYTLRGLSTFTLFNATALAALLGFALASIIIMPPAAIPVMIGLLIVLGVNIVALSELADELESRRGEIVCQLYASRTVEEMVAALADAIDIAIAALGVTALVAGTIKAVALLLTNADTLGQIISGIAGAAYPGADCSDCVCSTYLWDFETDEQGWEDYTNNGGGTYWDGGKLWFDTPINPPENGHCGWQLVFPENSRPLVATGDQFTATYAATTLGTAAVYVQVWAENEGHTVYTQTTVGDGGPKQVSVTLTALADERISRIAIYEDTILYAHTGTWDYCQLSCCQESEG